MAEKLTQTLVTRYAKYRALKNLLDDWLEKKRELVMGWLSAGHPCPDRGPYLLYLDQVGDRVNWKEAFAEYLEDQGLSAEEVRAVFTEIEERPREKSTRIRSKANPNYKRTFPIKLPS
jgi:hypothetical protein